MPAKDSGVVRWPAFLAAVPLLVLAFAPQAGLSPYVAVPITAFFGGLGVFLSLAKQSTKARLLFAAVGALVAGAAATVIAVIVAIARGR